MTKHLIKGIVRSGVIHEDGAPQLVHEWLHELLEKAEGTSVTITVEFGNRVGTAKWKCPGCGLKFDAKEPRASIPVSVVRCPKCGDIAEREEMMSEDEIRELLRYYQGCPIDEIETWKETKEYMLGYVVGLLKRVLGEGERQGEKIHCPKCGTELEASGMCCNSGEDSGYQCYCEKCKIMWVDTFDDRMIVDEYLTAIARKPQRVLGEEG